MSAAPVIAVDGPSGTGKGTVCVYLADRLGWHFLDSGALYRAIGVAAADAGTEPGDGPALAALAERLEVEFSLDRATGAARTLLGERDVSEAIRTEECGNAASRVAEHAEVRVALLQRQREFRRPPGLVADGRDMGTVVFPDAELKLFLTASPEERARRRYKQLKEKGINVSLPRLSADIAERDTRDRERTVSPLRPAPDAVVIDTTALNEAQVCERVSEIVREKFPDVPVPGTGC